MVLISGFTSHHLAAQSHRERWMSHCLNCWAWLQFNFLNTSNIDKIHQDCLIQSIRMSSMINSHSYPNRFISLYLYRGKNVFSLRLNFCEWTRDSAVGPWSSRPGCRRWLVCWLSPRPSPPHQPAWASCLWPAGAPGPPPGRTLSSPRPASHLSSWPGDPRCPQTPAEHSPDEPLNLAAPS